MKRNKPTKILFTGSWWLSSQPSLRVGGNLVSVRRHDTRLRIVGELVALKDLSHRQHTIFGETTDGTPITLYRSANLSTLSTRWRGRFEHSAASSQQFAPEVTIIGAHLAPEWPARFASVEFEVTHLAEWLKIPAFTDHYLPGTLSPTWEYSRPPDIRIALPSLVTLTVTSSLRGRADPLRYLKLVHSPALRIEATTPLSLDEWHRQYLVPLTRLITLGTERHNELTRLAVVPTSKREDRGAKVLLYPSRQARVARSTAHVNVPLGFQDIRETPSVTVGRWLQLAQDLDNICDLYFDATYSPITYTHLQFLNLAQAAEVYHRRRSNRKQSLQARLRALLDKVGEAVTPAIMNRDAFIRRVEDTRDYYTHYDVKVLDNAVRDIESLYWLAQQMALVLAACLYLELGFTPDRVKGIMYSSERFNRVVAWQDRNDGNV